MRLTRLRLLLPALLVAGLAIALSSCGGGGNTSGSAESGIPSDFKAPTAAPDNAQKGGTLTELNGGDIDHMDPGAAYYQVTYSLTLATQRSLMGWPPDATQPVPDLADGQPKVTDGGKTITFAITPGVHYSPPVDRAVKAQDVKYAIERTLLAGVPNGYVRTYLDGVVGFQQAENQVKADKLTAPNISGITTPDDHTLVIKLTNTSAAPVIQALSLPMSVPVPEEYAKKFDAQSPSGYERQRSEGLTQLRILALGESGVTDDYLVEFDEEVYTVGSGGNPNFEQPLVRLGYTTMAIPASVYDYDVRTRELTLLRRTPVLGDFDPADYEEHRLWAPAPDGERVPISIVCRRGAREDGPIPVLLYGYGAYETSIDPYFSVARLSLLDRGAGFAIAHVRGGGEMGRRWYDDGKLFHKQNTFTDFVACARHLIDTGWTSADRLVAEGGQRRRSADGRGGQPGPGPVRRDRGRGAVRRRADHDARRQRCR